MASRYEVEVTISSAKDLKNVNWRNGRLRPYAVVWVDSNNKCSTKVDEEGETSPYWDETLVIHLQGPIDEDTTLCIDIVHTDAEEDTKPLTGSAQLNLRLILDDVGLGEHAKRTLQLKRPSGRPQGKLDVKVNVRELPYRTPNAYYPPPYGLPPPGASRGYPAPPPYGQPYAEPAPNPYYPTTAPPSGYPDSGYKPYNAPPAGYPDSGHHAAPAGYPDSGYKPYNAPPAGYPDSGHHAAPAGYPDRGYNAPPAYGQPSYGQAPPYGEGSVYVYGQGEKKKSSKFGGMGTGLAVGALAGVLGGLAVAEGFDKLEDKIADDVAKRVEEDLSDDDF